MSTPQKNNERESSYNEEEWKIFLDQTAKDNDEFLWNGDMSSSLSSVETTEGDIDIEADPEFFGEVYALPKCPKLSFGELYFILATIAIFSKLVDIQFKLQTACIL